MMHLVLAQVMAFVPATSAQTYAPAQSALVVAGGFTLVRIDLPVLAVFPVLTGDAEFVRGLKDRVDVRARYSTHLGFIHRLGAELRVTALRAGAWSLAARVHPSTQFAGSVQSGVEFGGDVATLAGVLVSRRWPGVVVTLDAGVTVDWLVYERFDGRTVVDDHPYLGSVDAGLTFEWPTRAGQSLLVRAEAHVPTAPDDPFTVGGVVPRVLFGGAFGL